jgi:hypothetical protein
MGNEGALLHDKRICSDLCKKLVWDFLAAKRGWG